MNLHLDTQEEEQIEGIKRWWSENGTSVIWGLALGLALLSGWKWWQAYTANQINEASGQYQQILTAYEQGDSKKAAEAAQQLLLNHPNGLYAELTTLLQASEDIKSKALDAARARLLGVMNNAKQPGLRQLAALRLARLQLAAQEYDQAIHSAQQATLPAYQWAQQEVLGDVYLAQGKTAQARSAYEIALKAPDVPSMRKNDLQAKLDGVGSLQPAPFVIPTAWQPLPALGEPGTTTPSQISLPAFSGGAS